MPPLQPALPQRPMGARMRSYAFPQERGWGERCVVALDAWTRSWTDALGPHAFAARQSRFAARQQGVRYTLYGAPHELAPATGTHAARLRRDATALTLRAACDWSAWHLLGQLRLGAFGLALTGYLVPRVGAFVRSLVARHLWAQGLLGAVVLEYLVGPAGGLLPLIQGPRAAAGAPPARTDAAAEMERAADDGDPERELAAALARLDEATEPAARLVATAHRALRTIEAWSAAWLIEMCERGVVGAALERPLVALAYALEDRVGDPAAALVWGVLVPIEFGLMACRLGGAALMALGIYAAALVLATVGNVTSWGLLEAARTICTLAGRRGSERARALAVHIRDNGCEPVRFALGLAHDPVAADQVDAQRLRGRLELPLGAFVTLRAELRGVADNFLPRHASDQERTLELSHAHGELVELITAAERGAVPPQAMGALRAYSAPEQCRAAAAALWRGRAALLRDDVIEVGDEEVLPRFALGEWVVGLWCRERALAAAHVSEGQAREEKRAALDAFITGAANNLLTHTEDALLERSHHALHQLWVLTEALRAPRVKLRSAASGPAGGALAPPPGATRA